METKDFKTLAHDVYYGEVKEFSQAEGQKALRNAFSDALGGELSLARWNKNKYDVFELISVAVDAVLPTLLTNQFDQIADVRNVGLGDKPVFKVQDPRMVRVARVASGTQELRRQTVTSKNFTIDTEWIGAEVYAEFEQFMAGDLDWNKLVDKIATSMAAYIQERMGEALTAAYTTINAKDRIDGVATIDKLVALATRIQTKANAPVAIYGTKSALAKIAEMANVTLFSGAMKDEFNNNGYLGTVRGIKLIEIPQAFKVNKDEFALDDTKVLVLPEGEKIIGVVFEGATQTVEPEYTSRNDLQLGFKTLEKVGVSVLQMKVYGVAQIA